VHHHTAHPHSSTGTCYACGEARPAADLRPFGLRADGTVAAHVCATCATPAPRIAFTPQAPRRNWCPALATS
jgi:hypothetical protein